MTHLKQIGDKIRRLREYRSLSQSALGELIGSDGQRISKIEQGRVNVTINTLVSIASALNCTIDINFTPATES